MEYLDPPTSTTAARTRNHRANTKNTSNSKSVNSLFKYGCKVDVVITSPEMCMTADDGRGMRILSKINWEVMVLDEAHRLKNHDSKLTTALRTQFAYSSTVLLTGTPLQNNTDELWALLHFVDRVEFEDRQEFADQFGSLVTTTQLDALHNRLKPYLLRREKHIVEKGVPPKEEVIIEVELTACQKQYYRALYEKKTSFLRKRGAKDGPSLLNLAMELRKCCNHPFLIKGAEKELTSTVLKGLSSLNQIVQS